AMQVNQVTEGGQFAASAAVRPGDEATMVWSDYGLDSSGMGVYGRRLDAKGQPIGNQFRVNDRVEGDQTAPAIGSDAAGNTVVIWQDVDPSSGKAELYFQRYDAGGGKIGENAALPGTVDLHSPLSLQVAPEGEFSVVVSGDNTYRVRNFTATGSDLGGFVN